MCQAESWPKALRQVLQNSKSRVFMWRVKPCQHKISIDKIQEKIVEGVWECSNSEQYKAHMSVHWLA